MHISSSKLTQIYIDGTLSISTFSGTSVANRDLDFTLLGKISVMHPSGVVLESRFWNGDIAGLFVVDESLSVSPANAIAKYMRDGVDLTDTTCPSGNACTTCAAGEYKSIDGSSPCLTCPTGTAGTTSPVGCTSSDACMGIDDICKTGYIGQIRDPCTACLAGTYKSETGTTACIDCASAAYSTTTSATACLACPANSGASCSGCSAAARCTCNPRWNL